MEGDKSPSSDHIFSAESNSAAPAIIEILPGVWVQELSLMNGRGKQMGKGWIPACIGLRMMGRVADYKQEFIG